MTITTTDPTQRKIHTSSHGGNAVRDELLVRVRRMGVTAGKEHPGLKAQGCSTDLYAESEEFLVTLEVKNSASSPTCRGCGEIESVHLVNGCEHAGRVFPNHKNCGNRFRDAVGSITNQLNSQLVQSLKSSPKRFIPHFLFIDRVQAGGPNVHSDGDPENHKPSHMGQVVAAGGRVMVYTQMPTPAELDEIVKWMLSP